jgi:hypothetical protein
LTQHLLVTRRLEDLDSDEDHVVASRFARDHDSGGSVNEDHEFVIVRQPPRTRG